MRIVCIILSISLFISCRIFRKSSEEIKYTASRDSSSTIDTKVDLKRDLEVRSNEKLYTLQAQGFRSISVDKHGNITAEGENGRLDLSGVQQEQNKKEMVDSNAHKKSKTEVQQGEDLEVATTVDTEVKSEGISFFWFGMILGVIILLFGKQLLKKINLSFITKLWSNSK